MLMCLATLQSEQRTAGFRNHLQISTSLYFLLLNAPRLLSWYPHKISQPAQWHYGVQPSPHMSLLMRQDHQTSCRQGKARVSSKQVSSSPWGRGYKGSDREGWSLADQGKRSLLVHSGPWQGVGKDARAAMVAEHGCVCACLFLIIWFSHTLSCINKLIWRNVFNEYSWSSFGFSSHWSLLMSHWVLIAHQRVLVIYVFFPGKTWILGFFFLQIPNSVWSSTHYLSLLCCTDCL